MLPISSILDELQKRVNPSTEPLRAFIDYFTQFREPQEVWNSAWFFEFFSECMHYPHWRQNRNTLLETLREALVWLQQDARIDLKLDQWDWTLPWQVIEIQNPRDTREVLEQYLRKRLGAKDQYVLKFFQKNHETLALIFHQRSNLLEIRWFDREFTLQGGELVPLRNHLGVIWGRDLEPLPERCFALESGPFTRATLTLKSGLWNYAISRGYLFTPVKRGEKVPLSAVPSLFMKVKYLESLFLTKEGNPFYQEIIQDLERLSRLLRMKHPLSQTEVTEVLIKARNAWEWVFPEDKLLGLLLQKVEGMIETLKPQWTLSHLDFIEGDHSEWSDSTVSSLRLE